MAILCFIILNPFCILDFNIFLEIVYTREKSRNDFNLYLVLIELQRPKNKKKQIKEAKR